MKEESHKTAFQVGLKQSFWYRKWGEMGMEKGNFNDEVMRHPAEHGEPSVLQPALTTSFSHAFRIDLVIIINNAFRIDLVMIINDVFRI